MTGTTTKRSITRKSIVILGLFLAAVDACCVLAAFALAAYLLCPEGTRPVEFALANWGYAATLFAVWCIAATDQRLFASHRSDSLVGLLFTVVRAYFGTLLFAAFLMALFSRTGIDRGFLLLFAFAGLSAILVVRLAMRLSLWDLRRRGYNYRRILFIGANERTAHLVSIFRAHEQYGYHLEGFLEDDPSRSHMLGQFGLERLGAIADLERLLLDRVIDAVYVALPLKTHYETIMNIASLCEGVGVPVRLVADLFPVRNVSSDVSRLGDIPLFSLAAASEVRARRILRRAVDVIVASILLLLFAPWLLLVAVIIRLESPGPAIAPRWCATPGKQPFRMYAFRTRRTEPGSGSFTRSGATLHRYGLDELPQLLNVLAGHMSLTDPRPPELSETGGAMQEHSS